MTTRTHSLLDSLIVFVRIGLISAGVYFAASHDVDRRVKAAVDCRPRATTATTMRQSREEGHPPGIAE